MNFPRLTSSKLHEPDHLDDIDPAEIDRRLAGLAETEIVPVRQDWIEATVAEAAATRPALRPSVYRAGPFRRLLAAAIAMLGVHGTLAAATVGAGVVAAAVLWTSGRNASETLPYATALQVLGRTDQSEEHRLAALTQVLDRLRSSVTVLIELHRDPGSPQELALVADGYLERLRSKDFGSSSADLLDPLGVLVSARRRDLSIEERRLSLAVLGEAAIRCMSAVHHAEPVGEAFADARQSVLRRMDRMIRR